MAELKMGDRFKDYERVSDHYLTRRQPFSDGNYYFVGLDNPWVTEILVREDKLRKVE